VSGVFLLGRMKHLLPNVDSGRRMRTAAADTAPFAVE